MWIIPDQLSESFPCATRRKAEAPHHLRSHHPPWPAALLLVESEGLVIGTKEELEQFVSVFEALLEAPKTWTELEAVAGGFGSLWAIAKLEDRKMLKPRELGEAFELDSTRVLDLLTEM